MDVVCGRCGAEYDFDDTLISAQGTTVRCTDCGYQFRIFPSGDRGSAPENWTLTPARGKGAPLVFDSLHDLQRAISRGEVGPDDLLARGGERARPLRAIAELAPLLNQPRSVPPPGRGNTLRPPGVAERGIPTTPAGSGDAPRRAATGTVLGLAAPPVPRLEGPPPPASDFPPDQPEPRGLGPVLDGELYVPSSLSEESESPVAPAERLAPSPMQQHRPRVRSVLGPRAPLDAATFPSETRSGDDAEPPPPPPDSSPWDSSVERDFEAPPYRRDTPSRSLRSGPVTPTPSLGLPAYPDQAVSRGPGTERRPGARGLWIVLAVLISAGSFVAVTMGERLLAFGGRGTESSPESEVGLPSERIEEVGLAIDLADEAWLGVRLADDAARASRERELDSRLTAAALEMDSLPPVELAETDTRDLLWLRVHLLRLKGALDEARALLPPRSPEGPDEAYALALLDLADPSAERPDAVVLRRLKEASTGERGRFLARSAYIYALSLSGRTEQARADLAALAQLKGGREAPLFDDLDAFLSRQGSPGEAPGPAPTGE